VDLLPIMRTHYYHADQHGSWSIKKVLPTIAPELAYEHLEGVRDGGEAQAAYQQMIGDALSVEEKEILKRQMLEYCARDTLGLLVMVNYFSK
jgi:membrane-bound ClpP family serine protease